MRGGLVLMTGIGKGHSAPDCGRGPVCDYCEGTDLITSLVPRYGSTGGSDPEAGPDGYYHEHCVPEAPQTSPLSPEERLAAAWDSYTSQVTKICEEAYQEHVRPVLKASGLTMVAGMGGWSVDDPTGKRDFSGFFEHDTPAERSMFEVLNTELPGLPAHDLGSWIDRDTRGGD